MCWHSVINWTVQFYFSALTHIKCPGDYGLLLFNLFIQSEELFVWPLNVLILKVNLVRMFILLHTKIVQICNLEVVSYNDYT